MPIEELRDLLHASRQTLTSLVGSLADRPDMQNAIRRLMRPDDMLETFSELAVREPDLMRLVLQASVAALIAGGLDNVRWDLLSDAAKGPTVWAALARKMGPQALRMNLNTLLRHDVLATSAMVDYVADRIADESEIRRSKQFPYQYFAAYLNADDNVPQKIKTALHKAAENRPRWILDCQFRFRQPLRSFSRIDVCRSLVRFAIAF
jgi:hypothetical protein